MVSTTSPHGDGQRGNAGGQAESSTSFVPVTDAMLEDDSVSHLFKAGYESTAPEAPAVRRPAPRQPVARRRVQSSRRCRR